MTNPLVALNQLGQFVWLDAISRSLIVSGELARLIDEDGLGGVTSNPTIFDKAIANGTAYDAVLARAWTHDPGLSGRALAEHLIVDDIQLAADLLRRVYDDSGGANGFVSIEVSPGAANDSAATIAEARHLWKVVARPNAMVKVPATSAGVEAVETLTAEGININITLMFSLEHYDAVAQAYLRGIRRNPRPRTVTSVASIFVSRVDVAADRLLDAIGTPDALALRGRLAVANATTIYRRFRELFHGDRFAAFARDGVRMQRVLWASTGTKNAALSDVFYLEELIAADTITTVPPETLAAFRDHGRARITLDGDDREARHTLDRAKSAGLDLHAVTEQLQVDGIKAFSDSFDHLLGTLAEKRRGRNA